MVDRLTGVWLIVLGAVGLLVVMALMLLGRNVRDAARKGPRWQRRLVAATLASLASIAGFAGWHEVSSRAQRKAREADARPPLPRGNMFMKIPPQRVTCYYPSDLRKPSQPPPTKQKPHNSSSAPKPP